MVVFAVVGIAMAFSLRCQVKVYNHNMTVIIAQYLFYCTVRIVGCGSLSRFLWVITSEKTDECTKRNVEIGSDPLSCETFWHSPW